MIKVGQPSWKAILKCLLDAWVCGFEALEHIKVLLPIFKVLSQQPKSFKVLELSGPKEAKDEGIICAQEANVWPSDHHVPDLLDVLVQGVRVLVQFQTSFLQSLG